MAYHHVVEMVDWSIKNVTFFMHLNYQDKPFRYKTTIFEGHFKQVLSIVKIEIMRLLSKHVSRNHICGQHMEVMHLNINMWIQQLEGGDAQNIMFLINFLQVDESCETTYNMNKDDMICVADDM